MVEDLDNQLIQIGLKEVNRVPRGRTVKDTPKRGKLTKRQIDRVVEKVVYARRGIGAATSSVEQKRSVTSIKVGRDAKTGRFISCKDAERRKATAVVETIKRPNKWI